jgi:hypothetical protein
MDRREFVAAAGTVAAVASTSQALRKWLLKSQIYIRRSTRHLRKPLRIALRRETIV